MSASSAELGRVSSSCGRTTNDGLADDPPSMDESSEEALLVLAVVRVMIAGVHARVRATLVAEHAQEDGQCISKHCHVP